MPRSPGLLQYPAFGGAGAYVTGTLPVTPGETLRVIVGAAGVGRGASNGVGGGGAGFSGSRFVGSSGGGRSAIQRMQGGVWVDVVSAGGGGGGCYSYNYPVVRVSSPPLHLGVSLTCTLPSPHRQPAGGAASWNATGFRGTDEVSTTVAAVGAGGGSRTAGGSGVGGGASGAAGVGGTAACPSCNVFGGGGGGGAFGGGAAYSPTGCGGGGGGSSLTSNLVNARGESASPATPNLAGGLSSPFLTPWTNTPWLSPGNNDADGLVVASSTAPCDAAGACYKGISTFQTWAAVSASGRNDGVVGRRPRCMGD